MAGGWQKLQFKRNVVTFQASPIPPSLTLLLYLVVKLNFLNVIYTAIVNIRAHVFGINARNCWCSWMLLCLVGGGYRCHHQIHRQRNKATVP